MPSGDVKRKPPRSRPGSKPFAFDQHGDVVHLDDDCGATVHVADPLFYRALAMPPVRR